MRHPTAIRILPRDRSSTYSVSRFAYIILNHPFTRLKFVYDWEGRRIARHVWRGGSAASPTFDSSKRWLYDGWNPVAEFTASSAASTNPTRATTFTWGLDLSGTLQGAGGVGGLLAQTTVAGTVRRRPSYDGNGNITAWTVRNQTAPAHRREYDAFGNVLVSEGTAPGEFGFSTKMKDPFTGLSYYGYRYLDTATGRWLNRDPIGEEGGLNLFGFVGNDGVNELDKLGCAPGDLHESKEEAVNSVAQYIARMTADSRREGRNELQRFLDAFWVALFFSHKGEKYSYRYENFRNGSNGQSALITGVEYRIDVFCGKNADGKLVYGEGNLLEGEVPNPDQIPFFRGGGLLGAVGGFSYAPDSLVDPVRVAKLHTHNVGLTHKIWYVDEEKWELAQDTIGDLESNPPSGPDLRNKIPGIDHYVVYENGDKIKY